MPTSSLSDPAVFTPGSVYEHPDYLRTAAAHLDAEVVLFSRHGAVLPLLDCPDGVLRTVYGMPRPYGEHLPDSLGELGHALTEPGVRLEAILSPLASGPELARQLSVRGGRLTAERKICVVRLAGEDPTAAPEIATVLEAAATAGAGAEITTLGSEAGFGPLHRAAMAACDAPAIYLMDDGHFAALAALDHFLVSVTDADGVAAAALFLTDGRETYLHLGASRVDPAPVPHAMSLAIAEGVREAGRRQAEIVVLGGGRNDRSDESLLRFKRTLATELLPRYTIKVGV